jgi:hypothetical protein
MLEQLYFILPGLQSSKCFRYDGITYHIYNPPSPCYFILFLYFHIHCICTVEIIRKQDRNHTVPPYHVNYVTYDQIGEVLNQLSVYGHRFGACKLLATISIQCTNSYIYMTYFCENFFSLTQWFRIWEWKEFIA